MPKTTFNNLKEEKKERILNAAINEFAEHGVTNASVNRIVKGASIATGSFYQYFEDIEDLFIYAALEMAKEKGLYIKAELDTIEERTFEKVILALYKGSIKFAYSNMQLCELANKCNEIKNTALYKKLIAQSPKTDIYEMLIPLLEEAKEKGEVRKDMDITLFFSLLNGINVVVLDYMATLNPDGKFDYTKDDLSKYTDLAVSLILNSIK